MIKKIDIEQILAHGLEEIWKVLTVDERNLLVNNCTIRHFKKNQIIYAEGEDPDYWWILLQGKVKKFKNGVNDRIQILRMHRPVQYFGYRAYFANEKYVSSAAAFETSVLAAVPLTVLEHLIRGNVELAMFFIHELSRNLGGSDTKIVNLTQKHIRGRLAEAILLLAENYGFEDDDATLKIYMSREDLANLSNMTTSNAIRTLSCFVNEKLLVVDGRRIKIVNEAMLRKISRFG